MYPMAKYRTESSRQRQRGVALLTALLVVSLATTAAVSMASRQQIDIRRTANLIGMNQARLYALGMEDWAGQVLMRDLEDGPIDHLEEDWAQVLPPIEVEGGQVSGYLQDLQGRFNLNNLVDDVGKPVPEQVSQFRRLLSALTLDPELASAVLDWVDADVDLTFPGGAEDGEYLSLETPYRTANRRIGSPSELMLIQGIDAEVYAALEPHVAVLPETTAINVNTATVPVLMSLAEGLTEADADALIGDRGDSGYESVEVFTQHPALAGRGDTLVNGSLAVASNYFLLISSSQGGRIVLNTQSLLARGGGGVKTVTRAFGTY